MDDDYSLVCRIEMIEKVGYDLIDVLQGQID
jgi:hypothetical protein